jgi:serine/threonine protein kinase/tetratricopeptide (TPR) repeat protein
MDPLQSRLASALGGRYTVEREIGRGGMSIVFLGRDLRLERPVAIKVLRPELTATIGTERFLREIKVAAQLQHPYILKLHESGESWGLLYYVMPFVEGDTLRHRMARERTIPVVDAVRIAQEVAEALDHAHRQNIVHRDIKPENILFEEGHAVVADFGIARAISAAGDRDTGSGIVLGTVDYMSPEQESGSDQLDGRTDIYSLGIVFYEMLVGETPGPDHGVDSLTGRRPDLPTAIVRVLRRALARDPADRFATARELVMALASTRGSGTLRRERGRTWKWELGVGIAAAVALVVVVFWIRRPPAGVSLDPTRIAVLYFDDLSADSSLGAIATGLSEDLIDALAQVPALGVISQDGVRPYRGRAVSPDSIARARSVGTIVSGSVSRSGDLLRVVVRLVDGATGQLLHSRQVIRPHGELFALQDTITADIAAFLRPRIGEAVVLRERRAGTSSVAAWELVRRGDVLRDGVGEAIRRGDEAAASTMLRRADSLYARAEALDRAWVVAPLGRARVAQAFAALLAEARPAARARAALTEPVPRQPRYEDEWIRVALARVDEVLRRGGGGGEADPRHADAVELRGSLRYLWWLQGYTTDPDSLRASEADLRAAVAATPSMARGWARLSQLLRYTGRFADAAEAAERALEADAFLLEARSVYRTLYFAALNLERYDDARSWCARARSRFPTDTEFGHCELRILGWSGRGRAATARAWRLVDSLDAVPPASRTGVYPADRRLLLAALYGRSGEADSAAALLGAARAAAESDSSAAWFLLAEANIRVLLQQRDAALALIARVVRGNPQLRDFAARAAWFRPLQEDAEFQRLVSLRPGDTHGP